MGRIDRKIRRARGATFLEVPSRFARVADAIESTLRELCPDIPPFINCKPRAAVACALLSELTGERWMTQGGTFIAQTRASRAEWIGWNAERARAEGRDEHHAWACLAPDEPARPGPSEVRVDRVWVFDPSVRHLPEHAATLGTTYARLRAPVAYGSVRTLRSVGFSYEAEVEATLRVREDVASISGTVRTMLGRAKAKLEESPTTMTAVKE